MCPTCSSRRRPDTSSARFTSATGLGLVEVLIATGLLATLVAGLGSVLAASTRSVLAARHRTSALILAVDQVERLRGEIGRGQRPASGSDYLDRSGRPLSRRSTGPTERMFVRAWQVRRHSRAGGVFTVDVMVAPVRSGERLVAGVPPPDGARLLTLVRLP